MPLPSPNKGQSQDEFISMCMSNDVMQKEFPDQKQRSAVCFSQWRKNGKEFIFSKIKGFEVKEVNGKFIRSGYIATTHLDSGFPDPERGVWVRDKITKETLDAWADDINNGNPRANKVSLHHNREPEVVGVGMKGSAHVDRLPDGEYGLYVDTLIDDTKSDFPATKSKIENGVLDSFSIEFTTKDVMTDTTLENAVQEIQVENGIIRQLMPGTLLEGWALASRPMNEYAIMIKEVLDFNSYVQDKKSKKLDLSKKPKEEDVKMADTNSVGTTPKLEEEKELVSKKEIELLKKYKELEEKEAKSQQVKELAKQIKEELKVELDKLHVENKIQTNRDVECKEFMEYKEMFKPESKVDVDTQFKVAGKVAEKLGMIDSMGVRRTIVSPDTKEFKYFGTKGTKLEFKGLGITTNQNTDTDYLLASAELADVFDPVIYNALNEETVTWNLLAKDDYSNKGNNQVQFTLKTVANATAGAYTGNAITTGNTTRLKFMTKFKKYFAGVEIDGDMLAAARGGPISDVFSQEVRDATDSLLSVINQALFAEVGLETAAGIIGFEFICDSAGNTTMYSLTRSTTNKLAPDSAGNTYINGSSKTITVANLRSAKRNALKEGAKIKNLVFVTDHVQGDLFRSIYDAAQRPVPTSSRFGFTGMMEFDGVPIFEDKDCGNDDWFLIDLETHRVAVWVPPTLEMLGKDSDSQKGFIKTYFATYNRAPRRMAMIYDCATS